MKGLSGNRQSFLLAEKVKNMEFKVKFAFILTFFWWMCKIKTGKILKIRKL